VPTGAGYSAHRRRADAGQLDRSGNVVALTQQRAIKGLQADIDHQEAPDPK
jgi:hypothetical protein